MPNALTPTRQPSFPTKATFSAALGTHLGVVSSPWRFDGAYSSAARRVGIVIAGELFSGERDADGLWWISHPEWSLLGQGSTLDEAESSLRTEARDLYEAGIFPADADPRSTSRSAMRLGAFLARLFE